MTAPDAARLLERLHQLSAFRGLPADTLAELARGAAWRDYAPSEVVFLEGETPAGLNFLDHGWLKVVKYSAEGREQVLRVLGPGETFNEVAAFANRPNPATAIALEAAGVWQLQHAAVMSLVRSEPDVAQRVIENMADRVIDLVNLVADLSLRTVSGRLARLLLDEAVDGVASRQRWRTQADLAARLGTVPDVIQRALRDLEAARAIDVHRSAIRILDRAALEKLAA